jgi:hypothetical protein
MADEEKIVDIILRYSQQGADEIAKSETETEREHRALFDAQWDRDLSVRTQYFSRAVQQQKEYNEKVRQMNGQTQGTFSSAEEKEVTAEKKEQLETAKITADVVQQGAQYQTTYANSVKETANQFKAMRSEARMVGMVSRQLAAVGAAMTAGILLDAQNYVTAVGKTTKAGQEWTAAQDKIKEANLEIGKSASEIAIPAMQKTANYIQSLANIVNQNPWILQGALGFGGVLASVGAVGMIVSQAMRMVGTLGLLATKLGLSSASSYGVTGGQIGPATQAASSAPSAATAGVSVMALIVGAYIGNQIGNAINKAIGQHEQNFADNFMTIVRLLQLPMTLLVKGLGSIIPGFTGAANGFLTMENSLDHFVGTLLGASQDVEEENKKAAAAQAQGGVITEQETKAYIAYEEQKATAEHDYEQQRLDTVKEYGQKMADAEKSYTDQRAETLANFAQQQAQQAEDDAVQRVQQERNFRQQQADAEKSYNLQRSKVIASANDAEIKAKEQHAIEMQRAELEHQNRLADLTDKRDALGIVRENAAFKLKSQQSEQDFSVQERDRKKNLQKQLSDMQQTFDEQRAKQLESYQQQIADQAQADALRAAREKQNLAQQIAKMDEAHKAEMAKLDQQERDTLTKQEMAYRNQIAALDRNLARQLEDLGLFMGNDRALRNAYYSAETQDLKNWITNNRGLLGSTAAQPSTGGASGFHYGGRASGGVTYGDTIVGENGPELAHFPNGTEIFSNKDTKAIAAVLASRGAVSSPSGGSLTINVNSRSLSVSEIRSEISRSLDLKLSKLLPALGV